MLQKSKAIVLKQFPYSETSIICHMFTEDYGKMSFIINGVRKKSAKFPANYFQTFNILDLVYQSNSHSDLHRINEISQSIALHDLPFNIKKSTISLFLAEQIYHSYKASESNQSLFRFLYSLIDYIDKADDKLLPNIHLWTLMRFTQFLGISPENNFDSSTPYFSLDEGRFLSIHSMGKSLDKRLSLLWNRLLSVTISELNTIEMSRDERQTLLSTLLKYHQIHIEGYKPSSAIEVLQAIFD